MTAMVGIAILALSANIASAQSSLSNIKVSPGNFSATITYQTSSPLPSYLWYGPSLAMVSSVTDPTPKTDHKITLGNLSPNTTYYFHIHLSSGTPTPSDLKLYSSFYTSTSLSTRLLQDRLAQLQSQVASLQGSPALSSNLSALSYQFLKNLKQGMTDPSVKELQKLLNTDTRHQVSVTGVGSKGQETTYFGPATKRAVIKFQELYKSETLTPAALSSGTGFVGVLTRNKLNALLVASIKLQVPSTQVATAGNAGGYGAASAASGASSVGGGSSSASGSASGGSTAASPSPTPTTPSPAPATTPTPSPTPNPTPAPSPSPTPTPAPSPTPTPTPNPTPATAPPPSPLINPGTTNVLSSISQYGITWTFDKEYPVGQFVNGDYWVVGPVTIISISPRPTGSASSARNGSAINILPDGTQPFDGRGAHYSSNQLISFPLTLQPDVSLISSVSFGEKGTVGVYADVDGNSVGPDASNSAYRGWLKSVSVLTVVNSAKNEYFRPGYWGPIREYFLESQANYNLLPGLTSVAGIPDLSTIERRLQRPWLDALVGWSQRQLHPADNMSSYGGDVGKNISLAAAMLMLKDIGNRTNLSRYMIQIGLDWYSAGKNGMYWPNDGGHAFGRKFPILFAGKLLNDSNMLSIGSQIKSSSAWRFGEDDQTFFITKADIDLDHHLSNGSYVDWGGNKYINYNSDDLGQPEWGITHYGLPVQDNRNWAADYRKTNGSSWAGFVLAARLLDLKTAWNHDALFDYEDRYQSLSGTDKSFLNSMWTAYRADAPPSISDISTKTAKATATITWDTDELAKSTINYGLSINYGSSSTAHLYRTSNSLTLSDLLDDTAYHFQIIATDIAGNVAFSNDGTFTIPVASTDP